MKKVIWYSILFFNAYFLSVITGCKCDEPTEDLDTVGINFFDLNPYSDFYNVAVLNFQVTQTRKEYEDAECGSTEVSNTLTIQNNTTKKVSFDYNIVFIGNNSGNIVWSYQGVATIASQGTLDVGEISDRQVFLNYGTIIIQSVNVSYQ